MGSPRNPASSLAIFAAILALCTLTPPAAARIDPARVEAIDCTGAATDLVGCDAFTEPAEETPTRGDGPRGGRSLQELVSDATSPDWTIRWHAVDALGTRREPAAIPALVRVVLSDDNNHPRWRALWAIRAIDASGSGAVPSFSRALLDPDPLVTRNAAVALAYFGQAEGRPTLVLGLRDSDPFRRWEAVFSLRKIADRSLAVDLQRALTNETDVRVRNEIRRLLQLVGEGGEVGSRDDVPVLRSN